MTGQVTTPLLDVGRAGRTLGVLLVAVLVTACVEDGPFQLSWGEALGAMLVFFLLFAAVWIFISLFADIIRRHDLGGAAKAGWVLVLVILPLLGSLIYIAVRPKVTEKDRYLQARSEEMTDDEFVAQLNEMKATGKISDADYDEYMRNLKR